MYHRVRKRTAELLEANRPDDRAGRIIDLFLITLIVANVGMIVLETVPGVTQATMGWLWHFEVFSVAVFSVEYLLRLWSCVDRSQAKDRHPATGRLKWMASPLGLIDLLAILPFYLYLFLPKTPESLLILRIFRGLRLLRIFKLTRYSSALRVMWNVARREASTLAVAAFLLVVILLMASWGIYMLERDDQPEVFSSIPAAMWWAIVTLTTVGYGDVVPASVGGKILASLISLIGIGMVAVPAGILASGFTSAVRERDETYDAALRKAIEDGSISEREAKELERLRERLGISQDQAEAMLLATLTRKGKPDECPHCGEPL